MKALVGAFGQEKALVGAFSVITNLRMELFGALLEAVNVCGECAAGGRNFNIQFKSGHVNDKCYTTLTLSRPLPALCSCFYINLIFSDSHHDKLKTGNIKYSIPTPVLFLPETRRVPRC